MNLLSCIKTHMSCRLALLALVLLCHGLSAQASSLNVADIKKMLVEEAQYQGVSPSLVLAIAKVESNFDANALSHVGARGVMQIMPATASQGFSVASHELYDAKVNIQVGVAFIKQLLNQYDGQVDIALSHYNGGSAVKNTQGDLRVIPATRNYVNKVRLYQRRFQQAGYDNLPIQTPDHLYAGLNNSPLSELSYAEQMALDQEPSARSYSAASQVSHPQSINDKPRITTLQQLREHNLTRNAQQRLETKPQITSTSEFNQATIQHSVEDKSNFIRGPKITNRTQIAAVTPTTQWREQNLALDSTLDRAVGEQQSVGDLLAQRNRQTKQQKVASWEAIFD